tara:strand:- start:1217 stop:1741 length:525 start_codon:yes stop_codon:yes gene_type:complete
MANKWKKRLKEIEAEKKKTGASLKGVWGEQQKRTKITQEYRAKNKAKKEAEAAAKRIKDAKAKVQKTQDRVKKILAQADINKMSFKKAFANKRASGAKTFTWRGKRYTTELAKPKQPKPKLKSATGSKIKDYFKPMTPAQVAAQKARKLSDRLRKDASRAVDVKRLARAKDRRA